MYADDTAIICDVTWKNAKKISSQLSSAVEEISKFFKTWKIKINDSKTEFAVFTKSRVMIDKITAFPPRLNGFHFLWKDAINYLGVTLDRGLSFKAHIDNAISKASNMTRTLFPLLNRSSSLPSNQKLQVYRAFIRPSLVYGCQIFTNCAATHFRKLQTQQNKCLRMALDSDWGTRTADLHSTAKIPTIRDHVDKLTANFYSRSRQSDNVLISNLGNYSLDSLDFRVKHRLPRALL